MSRKPSFRFVSAVAVFLCLHAAAPAAERGSRMRPEPEEQAVLTLDQAIARALAENPALKAASLGIRVAEAREEQAGLLPNPELELEVEGFGGSGGQSDFDAAEYAFRVSQLLELGGKRGRRLGVTALERELAVWDYVIRYLDLLRLTRVAFVDVLAAQERLRLSRDSHRLARLVLETVSERVRAGKVSPLEKTKASVALATSRILLDRAERELETARKNLSSAWGGSRPAFRAAKGDFESIPELPPLGRFLERIRSNAELKRREIEIELQEARLELERSLLVPDVTLTGGGQYFEETGDRAFLLALSAPIPVFDRNQGGLRAARHGLERARRQRRAAEIRVRAELVRVHQALSSFHLESTTLKNDVLPAARLAFDATREGYREGKFGYLDVLDAQRTLFETKARYIDALAGYHRAEAGMERLLGGIPDDPASRRHQGGSR